jgi:hypothetical protein
MGIMRSFFSVGIVTAILFLAASAFGQKKPVHYLFTNNDQTGKLSNSSTFYTVGAKGLLTQKAVVTTDSAESGAGILD